MALGALKHLATLVEDPWTIGTYARAAAVSPGLDTGERESRFLEALGAFTKAGHEHLEVALTHLQYGEWLRRERHRRRAAVHLRAALDVLAAAGHPLETRARRELALAEDRPDGSGATLTTQELAVAQLAATGHRNADIAGRLFVSRHTVDYHLRKVFQKLDVSSRRDLPAALRSADQEVAPDR